MTGDSEGSRRSPLSAAQLEWACKHAAKEASDCREGGHCTHRVMIRLSYHPSNSKPNSIMSYDMYVKLCRTCTLY